MSNWIDSYDGGECFMIFVLLMFDRCDNFSDEWVNFIRDLIFTFFQMLKSFNGDSLEFLQCCLFRNQRRLRIQKHLSLFWRRFLNRLCVIVWLIRGWWLIPWRMHIGDRDVFVIDSRDRWECHTNRKTIEAVRWDDLGTFVRPDSPLWLRVVLRIICDFSSISLFCAQQDWINRFINEYRTCSNIYHSVQSHSLQSRQYMTPSSSPSSSQEAQIFLLSPFSGQLFSSSCSWTKCYSIDYDVHSVHLQVQNGSQ